MSGSMSKLANGAKCECGNNDALRFRRFHDREEDELLGLQCKECDREYLKETFFSLVESVSVAENVVDGKGYILQPGSERFYLQVAGRFYVPEDGAHMVHSARTKIPNVREVGDYLKPGDHIAWHRQLGHWHHAIVTEIRTIEIRVIHWYSAVCQNPECTIKEQWIDLQSQSGSLYRMDYEEKIVKANPARLVIARARSRISEKGYHLIRNNCETLASFCKIGVAISQQILWAWKEIKNECKKSGLKTAAEVGVAELIEGYSRGGQMVGFSLVIVIEGVLTYIDIKNLCKARKEGKQSRKEFVEQVTTRVTQAILCGGLAGLGGMVPCVGFVVGFLGGIVGKWIGSMAGPSVGQFIASLIEHDDKAVRNITDLQSGDHLVLNDGNQGSQHCLVQWYDEGTNRINIIHNTEKDGITQDWVDFVEPVYKVIYEENRVCCTPHEVWTRAVSMLGQNKYNSETFNSKDFAQLCRTKKY